MLAVVWPDAGTTRGARPSPLVRSALSGFSLRAVQSKFSTFVLCLVYVVNMLRVSYGNTKDPTWEFLYPKPR